MSLMEAYEWMDLISEMAFSSAEPLEARAFYALWWADLAYAMMDVETL